MVLIQFLLPLRDNAGQPFPRADFERVRTELTERFGGVTAFLQSPAAGAWKEDGGGSTVRDEVVLFELMTDALDRAWWGHYRRELERRFRQKALVVRALAVESL
ncbi:hypothetical protein HPC49_19865 [Pyxidicoccus fallax]|uniref:DUF1330 domain-containing protein n=1 Tax=Pyxidicoccus fallax TaxID=394095 RepID=A0A848LHD4_9BACT|nr:hypothetical protein [Pyxidicoccus fallax]NMO17185.1 hypothetical protein [Pyxidicoccus fallax]NPC80469.1 hypothetical protein [Pyxidicoccus fallax]